MKVINEAYYTLKNGNYLQNDYSENSNVYNNFYYNEPIIIKNVDKYVKDILEHDVYFHKYPDEIIQLIYLCEDTFSSYSTFWDLNQMEHNINKYNHSLVDEIKTYYNTLKKTYFKIFNLGSHLNFNIDVSLLLSQLLKKLDDIRDREYKRLIDEEIREYTLYPYYQDEIIQKEILKIKNDLFEYIIMDSNNSKSYITNMKSKINLLMENYSKNIILYNKILNKINDNEPLPFKGIQAQFIKNLALNLKNRLIDDNIIFMEKYYKIFLIYNIYDEKLINYLWNKIIDQFHIILKDYNIVTNKDELQKVIMLQNNIFLIFQKVITKQVDVNKLLELTNIILQEQEFKIEKVEGITKKLCNIV